ncbi:MAG TPA: helix-turn-helix domain-containing protein [Phycisphaerae bacterium]|nr:helix-turn-helix domain-containing protein [Phycisphaerae bacterium]
MTTREAAAELDVVRATVTQWIRDGILRAKRDKQGHWNVLGSSVRRLRTARIRQGK